MTCQCRSQFVITIINFGCLAGGGSQIPTVRTGHANLHFSYQTTQDSHWIIDDGIVAINAKLLQVSGMQIEISTHWEWPQNRWLSHGVPRHSQSVSTACSAELDFQNLSKVLTPAIFSSSYLSQSLQFHILAALLPKLDLYNFERLTDSRMFLFCSSSEWSVGAAWQLELGFHNLKDKRSLHIRN